MRKLSKEEHVWLTAYTEHIRRGFNSAQSIELSNIVLDEFRKTFGKELPVSSTLPRELIQE
jgi:hypothetical protein